MAVVKFVLSTLLLLTGCRLTQGTWKPMPDTQYEYFIDTTSATWHGARAECMRLGADLASVHNQSEADFITTTVLDWSTSDPWLGLHRPDDTWRWSDGSELEAGYLPWGQDEPKNDSVGRRCVYMKKASKTWFTSNCGLKKAQILCRREAGTVTPTPKTDPTTASTPGYCPDDYIYTGAKCFKVFSGETRLTWDEALTACRAEPGLRPDLMSIHSLIDNAFVTSQIPAKSAPLWIGGRKEGFQWMWSDNSDTNFKHRMIYQSENCLAVIGSQPDVPGDWTSQSCAVRGGYVCQTHRDPRNTIPTPAPTSSHNCTSGFTPFANGCYKFVAEPGTWQMAETNCDRLGGHLVAIHSEQENAAVQVVAGGADVWIGLKKGGSGEMSWSNGNYVLYTKWSGTPQGDCALQLSESGAWQGQKCDQKHGYVCKITTGLAPTTPAYVDGKCPPEDGWVPFGGDCFLFILSPSPTRKSWYEAMDECFKHYYKASLASIHHIVENDWVYEQIKRRTTFTPPDMFIGLHKSQQDGSLRWVDQSPVQFTHWTAGKPGDGACAVMSKYSMWKDADCDSRNAGYICKMPKIPRPTQPTEGPGSCPGPEWDAYGSSCFLYKPDEARRWFEAQELCLQHGGYLSSILSEHESDYLEIKMRENTHLPKYRPYWTGAIRLNSSSRFGWLKGAAMTFSHWGNGYPQTEGDCVFVDLVTGVWRNQDCQQRAGVLCRYEKGDGLSGGAIAGIVIGVLVLLSVVVVGAGYLLYYRSASPPTFNNPLSQNDAAKTTPTTTAAYMNDVEV